MKLYTFFDAAAAVAALVVCPASSSLSPEYSLPKLLDKKIRADVNRINGKTESVISALRELEHDDYNDDNGPDLPDLCLSSWRSVTTPDMIEQKEPQGVFDEETDSVIILSYRAQL